MPVEVEDMRLSKGETGDYGSSALTKIYPGTTSLASVPDAV